MKSIKTRRRTRDERGASAVEYGLMIAAIAATIVVTVFLFGGTINSVLFDGTCQKMVAANGTGDCT